MDSNPAKTPQEYLDRWTGWHQVCVAHLRKIVLSSAPFHEGIKWGHLVYEHDGPAVLIRAEDGKIRMGFWRGQRFMDLSSELVASGKYELATWHIMPGEMPDPDVVAALARQAHALNEELGNPQDDARR